MTRSTRALYLATTAGGQPDQAYVGFGLDWRRDRDRWNRRTGLVPGLQLELDSGATVEGTRTIGMALAPMLRVYLIAGRVALTVTPALLRAGAFSRRGLGFDVAARAGVAFHVGNVELSLDSFPVSYLPDGQRKALPVTARLGVLLD
jgi:catechol-2,3-dioxygenase